jgi:hypothetical protein
VVTCQVAAAAAMAPVAVAVPAVLTPLSSGVAPWLPRPAELQLALPPRQPLARSGGTRSVCVAASAGGGSAPGGSSDIESDRGTLAAATAAAVATRAAASRAALGRSIGAATCGCCSSGEDHPDGAPPAVYGLFAVASTVRVAAPVAAQAIATLAESAVNGV